MRLTIIVMMCIISQKYQERKAMLEKGNYKDQQEEGEMEKYNDNRLNVQ